MKFSGFLCARIDRLPSTQEYIKNLGAEDTGGEWPLVWVSEQMAGRGLGENTWESKAGHNLTFSFAWYPHFLDAASQFLMSKTVALAVFDFISAELPAHNVKIKWPNDIYVNEGKIAGILIENQVQQNEIRQAVIGIGINVNQEEFLSSAPNPVSMKQLAGKAFDLEDCLEKLCERLSERYHQLECVPAQISEEYLSVLYQFNETADYIIRGLPVRARITGISEFGHLFLSGEDDVNYECAMKEIIFHAFR